jgi:hypothetical protein
MFELVKASLEVLEVSSWAMINKITCHPDGF